MAATQILKVVSHLCLHQYEFAMGFCAAAGAASRPSAIMANTRIRWAIVVEMFGIMMTVCVVVTI